MPANVSNSSDNITLRFTPISELVLMPFSVFFNGLVILTFLLNNHIRTSFSFYLANLVLSNFIWTVIASPLNVVSNLYSYWWMGVAVCDLLEYLGNVLCGIIMNTHLLITLNRIWALTFPHSYARKHTAKTAVYCCVTVWVYAHIVFLPGLFINASNRLPLETFGCILNYKVLFEWNMFVEFVVYVLPQVLIIAAYPYLLCKRKQLRRVRQAIEVLNSTAERSQRDSKRAFRVLTASTISVTLLWTPGTVYYGMSCFLDISDYSRLFPLLVAITFLMQMLMDPILFMLVLPELRIAARQIFKRCFCGRPCKGAVAPVY